MANAGVIGVLCLLSANYLLRLYKIDFQHWGLDDWRHHFIILIQPVWTKCAMLLRGKTLVMHTWARLLIRPSLQLQGLLRLVARGLERETRTSNWMDWWEHFGTCLERLERLQSAAEWFWTCACEDKMSFGRWYCVQAKVNNTCGAKHPKLTSDRMLIFCSKNNASIRWCDAKVERGESVTDAILHNSHAELLSRPGGFGPTTEPHPHLLGPVGLNWHDNVWA